MFNTLNRFNTRSAKWDNVKAQFKRDDYLVFSVADSDYPTAEPIIETLKKRVEHGAFGYTKTDDHYFNAICEWFERRYQTTINPSWILPSSKVLSLLSTAIDVYTNQNDQVLIQTPVYHVFFPLVNQNHRTLIENPLCYSDGKYTMDFNDLETSFKNGVKLMVLCNPHNPVGRVWRYDELDSLVRLCKKYDVILLSDEIHADLILDPNRFVTVGNFFNVYKNIIIVHAPSKTFNLAGLHSAYAVIPSSKLRNALKSTLLKRFTLGQNAMAIEALITAYTQCDDWVDAQNKHISDNYKILSSFLIEHYPNSQLAPLEGTYLAWLDFTKYRYSCKEMDSFLINQGIKLSQGSDFGKQCDGFLRMNLAVSKNQLIEGLGRFKKAIPNK